jgi:hypothetical protein
MKDRLSKGKEPIPVSEPQKGDILCVNRGAYRHYGIYAGNSTVIHYAAAKKDFGSDVCVHETTLKNFIKNSKCIAVPINGKNVFSPDETLNRARSRIGENKYNIIFNNCEHFVYWCKTGRNVSKQVSLAAVALAAALALMSYYGKEKLFNMRGRTARRRQVLFKMRNRPAGKKAKQSASKPPETEEPDTSQAVAKKPAAQKTAVKTGKTKKAKKESVQTVTRKPAAKKTAVKTGASKKAKISETKYGGKEMTDEFEEAGEFFSLFRKYLKGKK